MLRLVLVFAFVYVALPCAGALAAETAAPDYSFKQPPQPLDRMKAEHPRLHITAERAAQLKKLVHDDKDYARLFAEIQKIADRAVADGPRQYVVDDGWSGTEQLWQREVGEVMPHLALAYLMTGERKYLDSAKGWMLTSLDYKTWGLGDFDGKDLAAGHQLYGIALAYDWLYDDLDAATRKTIREKLLKRANVDCEAAATKEIYWADSYLQNHLWVNITGIAAVGFALYGEADDCDRLINLPLEKYRKTFALLGEDGASFEGVPYWGYGIEYMLKFMDLSRGLLGIDFFKGNTWFSRTASFRLYSSLPREYWTKKADLMSFGDSPRFDWYGPDYILRKLAAEYKDGYAQGLADAVDEANVNHPVAQFLNVLWYDPSVAPRSPADLPAFKVFDDLGLVFMRTGWSGDETLTAFKCGPHVGFKALEALAEDPGSGHVHPDEGAFQIFAYGENLIADDGYTKKTTEYQNTILVNGVGQEGEGYNWFRGDALMKDKRCARILASSTTTDMDFVCGEIAPAYKAEAGLKTFRRSLYFLKPSTWVVVDELEAAKPSTFTLFFHSDFPFKKDDAGAFTATGTRGALRLSVLMPDKVSAESLQQELLNTEGGVIKNKLETLRVSNADKSPSCVFITVLSACPSAKPAFAEAAVETKDGTSRLTVKTPDRSWRFRLDLKRENPASPVLAKEQ